MTTGHIFVLLFEIAVALFGAWYLYELNKQKKEHK